VEVWGVWGVRERDGGRGGRWEGRRGRGKLTLYGEYHFANLVLPLNENRDQRLFPACILEAVGGWVNA